MSIGFVPTMGGLHEGHLSLVRQSKTDNDVTVVSLFLNPTQFNNANDLKTYPHNTDEDLSVLQSEGVEIAFVPTVEEMYPSGEKPPCYDLGPVAEGMEGRYRPGHFAGVVWIVSKLLKLVRPHKAYFGEKDFQQLAVVRRLVEVDDEINVEIVGCPIVREEDGLAMSSRNKRLTNVERAVAPRIYEGLMKGAEWSRTLPMQEVRKRVIEYIEESPMLEVEYFAIVDAVTLEELSEWSEDREMAGCITVYCGEVRLIDHIHFPSRYTTSR